MSTAAALLPHTDAIEAVLIGAGLTVSLGQAPVGVEPPYVVIYPDPGQAGPVSLADPLGAFEAVVQLTCVGLTAEQALSLSDRARAALSVPLAVTGRAGQLPEHLGGPPVQRDDDVTPPLFYAPAQFRIRSTP